MAVEIYEQLKMMDIAENAIYWCQGCFSNEYKEYLLERGLFNGNELIGCLRGAEAEYKLAKDIEKGIPFLCSRWGRVEGEALWTDFIGGLLNKYAMQNNAGIFPVDNSKLISEYLEISRNAARMIDYYFVATWC